jgi:hypothetical protein
LEADVLQRSNNFVGFFPEDWDMSAILMFAVTSFIITEKRRDLGGLVYLT